MKYLIFPLFIIVFFSACSIKHDVSKDGKTDVKKLSLLIINSSSKIDKSEAENLSRDVIYHSVFLANKYGVNTTALIHNTLVNLDIKQRGLCYHYAHDLRAFLKPKNYKSFEIKEIVAKRGEYFEHTALLLTRSDINFKNSIVLDAWRNTGSLYFSKVIDDKSYKWELR